MRMIAICLVTAVVVGCSNTDKRTFSGLSTTAADSRLGTVIALGKNCPTEEPAQGGQEIAPIVAPLVAAGVSLAASYIVKAIDNSIEEYKKGLSSSFTATGVAHLGIKNVGCIMIARGLLGTPPSRKVDTADKLSIIYPTLGLADYPAFYLELKAIQNVAARTVTLQPAYISYAASSARNTGSGRKYVTVAVALSQMTPKRADDISEEKAFAVFRHDLGRLEIGKRYKEKLLSGTGSSATFNQESYCKEGYNITALIGETEDPGLAFKIMSETFAAKKDDLEKALEETIKKAVDGKKKNE
jgi:hypothetical protein